MLKVINYHYIRESFTARFPSIFGVTPDAFRKQLLKLKKEGDFAEPSDVEQNPEQFLASKDTHLLVTFDDGLKEQYDFAVPILDSLDIGALYFVNSANFETKRISTVHKIHLLRSVLSSNEIFKLLQDAKAGALSEPEKARAKSIYRFDDNAAAELKYLLNFKLKFDTQEEIITHIFDNNFDENESFHKLYMSTENCVELAKKGYLGSHTHSHYPLGLLESDAINFELRHSKEYLQMMTGATINSVSYPYGSEEACTPEVATLAKAVGYKLGFTTKKGINDISQNSMLFNRFDCNDVIGGKNFIYGD